MIASRLFNQIEIAFWTTWVAVLRSPRTMKILPVLPVATAILAGMLLVGFLFLLPANTAAKSSSGGGSVTSAYLPKLYLGHPSSSKMDDSQISASIQDPAATRRPMNGQNNLLVVLVDRLEAGRPRLSGVWLLARAPALSQVTFLPLYPSVAAETFPFNESVRAAFRPDRSGGLPEEFSKLLADQGFWWDHYVIMDAAAVSLLLEMSGEASKDPAIQAAQDRLGKISREPQSALDDQTLIAQHLCDPSALWRAQIVASSVAGEFANSVRSDMGTERLRLMLRGMTGSGGMVCQFPLLTGR